MKKIWILLWICSWTSFLLGQEMSTYEYWLDTDYSNKVSATMSDEKVALSIETAHLSEGMHIFNFRAKDSKGRWSSPVTKYFYNFIEKEKNEVVVYEYWFDTDYNGKQKGVCSGQLLSDIDVSFLSEGMHFLNVRFGDKWGQWSSPIVHYFYHFPVQEPNLVTAYEYWFDTNYAGCRRGESDGGGFARTGYYIPVGRYALSESTF